MADRAKTRRHPGKPAPTRRPATPAPAAMVVSPGDLWPFAALGVLGAWTIVVPYLGRAIGIVVNVVSKVEIVDHVVPGSIVAAIGTYLAVAAYRGAPPKLSRPFAGGMCFLAGFWVLATHVSLVAQAVQGKEAWGSALWHAWTSVPIIGLSLWIVLKDG